MTVTYACRSDPVLQHVGHDQKQRADEQSSAAADAVQACSPPSDGHDLVRAGTAVIRDGSIKNLVSTYENKVQEVRLVLCLHRPSLTAIQWLKYKFGSPGTLKKFGALL